MSLHICTTRAGKIDLGLKSSKDDGKILLTQGNYTEMAAGTLFISILLQRVTKVSGTTLEPTYSSPFEILRTEKILRYRAGFS